MKKTERKEAPSEAAEVGERESKNEMKVEMWERTMQHQIKMSRR